jgi:glutathione-regulated potassium-efflux system ancillary protein KefG
MKVLILFAHPSLQKSHVNIHLISGLDSIEGVTFHDLYQEYPEFDIDVKKEQQLLVNNDVIIFHHPFFWYSVPAILKEWIDLVFEHDWAYGSKGNSLKGKFLMNFITAGGSEKAYCSEGYNQYTIREYLRPIEQTARLCKMNFVPPYVVYGTHSISEEQILTQKEKYFRLLESISDEKVDLIQANQLDSINEIIS